jgi:CRISPR-associated protein Cas2
MRLILIYDLPTVEKEDRKIYEKFSKDIKRLGFRMLQLSVYTKVMQNDTSYKQNLIKLNKIIPKKGSIIVFKITEKQFQNMQYLSGIRNKYETIVGGNELVIFGGDAQ